MKRRLLSLTALILLFSFFMSGFFWKKRDPQQEINEKIARAEESMKQEHYETAIKLYTELGEEGKEGLKNAYVHRIYEMYSGTAYSEKDIEAVDRFHQKIENAGLSLTEIYDLVWKMAESDADEILNYFEGKIPSESKKGEHFNLNFKTAELEKLIEKIELFGPAAPSSINSKLNDIKGKLKINWHNKDLTTPNFEEAMKFWINCEPGTDGYEIVRSVEEFKKGNIKKAVQTLSKLITHTESLIEILDKIKRETEGLTTEQQWEYATETRKIQKAGKTKDLAEAMSDADLTRFSISNYDGNPILSESERKNLPNLIGTNPNGKILILNKRNDFREKAKKLDIFLKIMDELPEEYYPEYYSEVEYIILVENTYKQTGTYTSGAKRLKETAKMTVYHVPTKKTDLYSICPG